MKIKIKDIDGALPEKRTEHKEFYGDDFSDGYNEAIEDCEECPICLSLFNEPRISSCSHMYCLSWYGYVKLLASHSLCTPLYTVYEKSSLGIKGVQW